MDFFFVTVLIFFLWLAAKKTKKLLRRLEPDDYGKRTKLEMIIVKASMDGVQSSHMVNPVEEPATQAEAAAVEEIGAAFEVVQSPAKAGEEFQPAEFTWEPAEEAELTVG